MPPTGRPAVVRARRPLGTVTRGTTARHRLRRVDRWLLAAYPGLLRTPELLVVDLGFGASPVTTLELAARLRAVNSAARVVGLDIDPARVAGAASARTDRVDFAHGGFELAGLRPHVVRAFNVLRQYDENQVPQAWQAMLAQLAAGGVLVDGTSDESGRLAAWVAVNAEGPQSLTLAVDVGEQPSRVAARLPKALIHHHVPGEPVHRLLTDLDSAWAAHAGLSVFGGRQRFAAAVADVRSAGWPVLDGPSRWRRGEATVAWPAVRASGY
ncbi:MAG: class I SAM-dependent methyltransferase [Frankiales bacterium]|nr:class I SAM-dependent methyltransferase [Frankiales bacterium]